MKKPTKGDHSLPLFGETLNSVPSPDAFPAQSLRILLDKAAIHGMLLTNLLYTSHIYRLIDAPIIQPILLGTYSGIVLIYTAVALLTRKFALVLIQVLYLLLIVIEVYHFAEIASTPVAPNATFQYILPTAFVAFVVLIDDGLGPYVVTALVRYSVAYTAIYAVMAVLFDAQFIAQESLSALLLKDPERGGRLYNFLILTALAWFFCLAELRRRPRILALAGLIMCGGAIVLTLSRVFILCILLITAMWLARFRSGSIRLVCLGILWAVSLSMLVGLIDTTWNPFAALAGDSSGSFRLDEYDMTLRWLRYSPIFGAGIPPSQNEIGDLTGNFYFAAGDLGQLGAWFDLGLFGLIASIAGSHIVCTFQNDLDEGYAQSMFLTGCLLTAYGCIGQTILYAPGGTFFAIVLAFWLRSRRGYDGLSPASRN